MRIFISAGEPSGDVHGANLIRSLQRLHPPIECVGFGGERMEAAGSRLLYPLCQLAVMGFVRVFAHAPVFLRLLAQADRYFHHHPPDAVVLIDYPGFNWWIARRAHFHRIPVFYFVPPQLWAWAGWRVRKMQRWVDHVLCPLPFEESWYGERGVPAQYIGHPYFDELPRQQLDSFFLEEQGRQTGPIIGLLPGSRNQEVERNLPTLIQTARFVHADRPDARFLVACFKSSQQEYVDAYCSGLSLPVSTFTGRTPDIIHLSQACVAVSGSVGLELLYHGKPTVVVYRVRKLERQIFRLLKTTPFISLVNLLAGKELFPEYLSDQCEAEAISRQVVGWLNDRRAYAEICGELLALREKVAQPGACDRAAAYVLSKITNRIYRVPTSQGMRTSA